MAEGDGRVSWYSLCYGESKTKGCGEGEGKECTMVSPNPSPLWQERAGARGAGPQRCCLAPWHESGRRSAHGDDHPQGD